MSIADQDMIAYAQEAGLFDQATESAQQAADEYNEYQRQIMEQGQEMLEGAVLPTLEIAYKAYKDTVDLYGRFQDAGGSAEDALGNIGDAIVEGAQNLYTAAGETLNEIAGTVGNFFTGIWSRNAGLEGTEMPDITALTLPAEEEFVTENIATSLISQISEAPAWLQPIAWDPLGATGALADTVDTAATAASTLADTAAAAISTTTEAVGALAGTAAETAAEVAGIALTEVIPVVGEVAAIGFGAYEIVTGIKDLFHHSSTIAPQPLPAPTEETGV